MEGAAARQVGRGTPGALCTIRRVGGQGAMACARAAARVRAGGRASGRAGGARQSARRAAAVMAGDAALPPIMVNGIRGKVSELPVAACRNLWALAPSTRARGPLCARERMRDRARTRDRARGLRPPRCEQLR